jgi:hypothetical protein
MFAVLSTIRTELSHKMLVVPQAFRAYAIASNHRLIPEMDNAARRTLDFPMTFEYLGEQLDLFGGTSKTWVVCVKSTVQNPRKNKGRELSRPTLPSWLCDLLSHYTVQKDCMFCLKVHAQHRNRYSEGLVERLEKARNIRMPLSLLSSFGVRSWDVSERPLGKHLLLFRPTTN